LLKFIKHTFCLNTCTLYLFKCPILGLLFGIIKPLLPSMDCKHQNTTSDIGHKPAISNMFNRFEILKFFGNFDFLWKIWIFWKFWKYWKFWTLIFFIDFRILKFYENFERVVSLLRHAMGCLPGNDRVVTRYRFIIPKLYVQ
jgi:hypothetical protein